LLISPLPPPAGGMASWTQKYMESEKADNVHVFLVNTALTGKRAMETNKRSYFHELRRTKDILSDIRKELNRNRIDIAHLNCAVGKFGSVIKDYLFARTLKKHNIRLVIQFHCDISRMADGKTDLFFLKRLVKLSDAVLTLNESSKRFIYSECNRSSIDMPNFVSVEYFDSISPGSRKGEAVRSVLFAGHVKKAKGCDVIYKTAEMFPEIQFTLLGRISAPFRNRNKPENVRLLGEVSGEQVKDEMLKSDVLLFPTHTEGFPYVVIEAMACGLPIISTPVGAIPDMIENSGGILVPVDDAGAVAEAINAMQNREIREKMAGWNRLKARNCYAADKVMERLLAVYRSITI
jgi:glycosyltransferase involved in cell wall biosynthesis